MKFNIASRMTLSVLLALSIPALSQTQSSTATLGSNPKPGLFNQFKMGAFGWSYGPSVTGFNDGRIPQQNGSASQTPSGIWTQLSPRVPAFSGFDFVVVPTFLIQPFNSLNPFQFQNPTVGLAGMLYDGPALKWWTRAEIMLPITAGSRQDGLVLGPQWVNVLSYRAPASPWDARIVLVPFHSLFSNGSNSGGVYMNPLLFFHLNENVAPVILAEVFTSRARNADISSLAQSQPSYLGAGFRYTWKSGRFVQPYLNSFSDNPSISNTGVALMFGGPIFN
ncbi:MAG: hypothetical protein K2X47_18745 [Bdellovibrionales bacterium]|nr:hypothetical protein [Bdellovibrionales bacterium]